MGRTARSCQKNAKVPYPYRITTSGLRIQKPAITFRYEPLSELSSPGSAATLLAHEHPGTSHEKLNDSFRCSGYSLFAHRLRSLHSAERTRRPRHPEQPHDATKL